MAEQIATTPTPDALDPRPMLEGAPEDRALTEHLLAPVQEPMRPGWQRLLRLGGLGVALLLFAIAVTVFVGIGTWGVNIPVAWAFAITNFVWWIGIGHAGTLISAILFLFQQRWRNSINRIAEAMTIFAVMNAGLFPLLHLGRPWYFYWLFPYPATTRIWPQFKSPLTWDVFAVSTYFTVSVLFWYVGLIPDLAALRDLATTRRRRFIYGIACLGWQGSSRHWHHYRIAYLLLAGLATPLVLSVHTIVSFDFAVSVMPGWHELIFPPYFVAGAIFSGFAMVMVLVIPIRRIYRLQAVITERHIEAMNKLILATSWMVAYGYITENFMAWYSGNRYGIFTYWHNQETSSPLMWLFWPLLLLNWILPQLLWWKGARTSELASFAVAVGVLIGMWLERFVLILRGINRDYLPRSWGSYTPTWVDWSLLAGTLGFFLFNFMLFLRCVPPVPVSELKELREEIAEKRELLAEKG
jgi:Ni/Fe-hydrogenase subunit HybB-like protein